MNDVIVDYVRNEIMKYYGRCDKAILSYFGCNSKAEQACVQGRVVQYFSHKGMQLRIDNEVVETLEFNYGEGSSNIQ